MLVASGEANGQADCGEETIYVAMISTRKHRLSGENPTVGIFYTRDAGATWQHTGWAQGKAFSIYVPEGSCGDTLWEAAGNGVMRSLDGGATWRIATSWDVTEVQDVAVDPAAPEHVLAATPYGVYLSTDLGNTWSPPRFGYASSVRFDRTRPGVALLGTEKGLLRGTDIGSDDGTANWKPTAITTPVRSVRQSPHDPDVWAIALQNNGVAMGNPNDDTWRYGDLSSTIYEVEFDPANEMVLFAGGWKTGLLKSSDAGATWQRVETLSEGNIHGIAISRVDPSVIIVGSMDDGVFVTRDGGKSWVEANPDLFDEGQVWDVHIQGE